MKNAADETIFSLTEKNGDPELYRYCGRKQDGHRDCDQPHRACAEQCGDHRPAGKKLQVKDDQGAVITTAGTYIIGGYSCEVTKEGNQFVAIWTIPSLPAGDIEISYDGLSTLHDFILQNIEFKQGARVTYELKIKNHLDKMVRMYLFQQKRAAMDLPMLPPLHRKRTTEGSEQIFS